MQTKKNTSDKMRIMSLRLKALFIMLTAFCQITIADSEFCDDQQPQRAIPLIISYSSSDCSFSLTASTYYSFTDQPPSCTLSLNPCPTSPPCFGFCATWKLFLNNSLVSTACTNNDTYTFTGLTELGDYKIIVVYLQSVLCSFGHVCVVHIDQGTLTINNNISCAAINTAHNNGQPFSAFSNDIININCVVQNNKTTVLQSSQKIVGQPGFRSGTGSSTYFHALIGTCSFKTDETTPNNTNNNTLGNNSFVEQTETQKFSDDIQNQITEIQNQETLIIPNPNDGVFTILTDDTPKDIIVQSILGAIIYHNRGSTSVSQTIDLQTYGAGVYIVKIKMASGRLENHKVVCQ
jgi:hypothetical protein